MNAVKKMKKCYGQGQRNAVQEDRGMLSGVQNMYIIVSRSTKDGCVGSVEGNQGSRTNNAVKRYLGKRIKNAV